MADVVLVLWTQHFANADEAVGKDAFMTREAALNGLRPRELKMVFLEKSI